jgi:hypothetical protein
MKIKHSLCRFYDLTYSSIYLFGHLFRGVAKQAACVCQLYLTGRFWAYVFELELADGSPTKCCSWSNATWMLFVRCWALWQGARNAMEDSQ